MSRGPWWQPKTQLSADEINQHTTHLAEIPTLYGQLPTIDEPDRADAGQPNDDGTHTQPGSRAPINLTVIHLQSTNLGIGWRQHDPGRTASIHRLGTLPALVWWTDNIARQMLAAPGVTMPPLANPATVATECDWLSHVTLFVLARPWAPLHVRDIATLHTRLSETVTGKREPWVPRCTKCNNQLRARDDVSWFECPACQKQYTPGTMVDLGRRQPPMSGEELAAILGISAATIRTWRGRKLISPARRDSHGRPLYYLADVLRVKERVRDRSHHRRKA